jgi:hypothetical protein
MWKNLHLPTKKLPIKKKDELSSLKDWISGNIDKVFGLLSLIGLLPVVPDPVLLTAGLLAFSLCLKHIDAKSHNRLVELLEEINRRLKFQEKFWTREENVERFFQLADDYLNCRFENNRKIFKKIIFEFLQGKPQIYDEDEAFFRKSIIEMLPSDIEFLCKIIEADHSKIGLPKYYGLDESLFISKLVEENPNLYRNLAQLIQRGFVIQSSPFGGTGTKYDLTDFGRKFYEYIKP